jgi:hypothetical protein
MKCCFLFLEVSVLVSDADVCFRMLTYAGVSMFSASFRLASDAFDAVVHVAFNR